MSAATGSSAVPIEIRHDAWRTRGTPNRVPMTLESFMTAPRLAVPRPDPEGLVSSTMRDRIGGLLTLFRLMNQRRSKQMQAAREEGRVLDLPLYDVPKRWHRASMPNYVPPWDALPEFPWQEAHETLESLGFFKYEHIRKSLTWIAARDRLYAENMTAPWFITYKWDTLKAQRGAREAGLLDEVEPGERFLRLPTDWHTCLGSLNHLDRLRHHSHWNNPKRRLQSVFNDLKFHCETFLARHAGPRPTEDATLQWANIRWDENEIWNWKQPKKHYKGRRIRFPEPWVLNDPDPAYNETGQRIWRYPNLEFYAEVVWPLVRGDDPLEGEVFVTEDGEPYKIPDTGTSPIANFNGTAMRHALGPDSPGAHARRRGCLTERARSWPLKEVALFADDSVAVVEAHYVDWDWIGEVGYDYSWISKDNLEQAVRGNVRPPMPPLDLSGWRAALGNPVVLRVLHEAGISVAAESFLVGPKVGENAPAGEHTGRLAKGMTPGKRQGTRQNESEDEGASGEDEPPSSSPSHAQPRLRRGPGRQGVVRPRPRSAVLRRLAA